MLGMDMFTYQTFSDAKAALTTAKMTYDHMTGAPVLPRGRPLARVAPQGAAASASRSPSSERSGPPKGILALPKQVRFNPNPRINALQTKDEDGQHLTRKEIEDLTRGEGDRDQQSQYTGHGRHAAAVHGYRGDPSHCTRQQDEEFLPAI